MYISPRKRKLNIIMFVIGLALIPISVIAYFAVRDWRSGASAEGKPQEVRITDITESAVVVSWVTPSLETEGWIRYSEDEDVDEGDQLIMDQRDIESGTTTKRSTHYVGLSNLEAGKTYYFVIGSGDKTYKDPDGNFFSFTTASMSAGSPPSPHQIYGTIKGSNPSDVIIYVSLSQDDENSFPVSTYTNEQGNFQLDVSHSRNIALDSRFGGQSGIKESANITIFAQGGAGGGALENTTLEEAEKLSLELSSDYEEVDLFAENSIIEVGDNEDPEPNPDPDPDPDPDPGPDPEPEPEEPEEEEPEADEPEEEEPDTQDQGIPTSRQDVPLVAMVLGSTDQVEADISEVEVTNLNENSFTVSWESTLQETGSLLYGETPDQIETPANDDRDGVLSEDGEYYTHHVTVKNLAPETTYYYKIKSGDNIYDGDEAPYQITTPTLQDSPPMMDSISGEIGGSAGADAVVTVTVSSEDGISTQASTVPDDNGRWTLSLGSLRTQDMERYFDYNDDAEITITGKTKGDEWSETYRLGDIREDIVSVPLEKAESGIGGAGDTDDITRGLYSSLDGFVVRSQEEDEEELDTLPDTSVNRIAVLTVTISLLMIIWGSVLLIRYYYQERRGRWEKEVLEEMDLV
jgi:hypothetical protein